ncbi:MAG: NRDE family protein [Myxococcota bacterium]
MCTIILLNQVHPTYPVVIAANRDEFFERPATPPQILHSADPRVIGGRDLRAGGTWMGATAGGLFVGLTNQRTSKPPHSGRLSRGEVVLQALTMRTVEQLDRWLGGLNPSDYNPFNLVYGDAHQLKVAYAHEGMEQVEREDVPQGLHVVPNARMNAPDWAKVDRARTLVTPWIERPWPELQTRLEETLADTQMAEEISPPPPPTSPIPAALVRRLSALRVDTPIYGTRSATIVALKPGRVDHYLFADGAPGKAPFKEHVAQLYP